MGDEDTVPATWLSEVLIQSLATNLGRERSGTEFVYHALKVTSAARGWHDALVSIEDPVLGRQLFRLGGAPVSSSSLYERSISSGPAVITEPPEDDKSLLSALLALCAVALHLDVLRHDASHDELTGLFNRRMFDHLLAQSISRSERQGAPFVLVLLDLDNFKWLNDHLGHDAGDRMLRLVGRELRSSLRTADVAARVGGDEFALIVAGEAEVVPPLMERLNSLIPAASPLDLPVRISAGFAVCPSEGTDAQQLYDLSDRRMYEDKGR